MAQMMQTMKQKDDIINQQNIKLGQINSNFGGVNNPQTLNNINGMSNLNGINNMNNQQAMNNMNGMNNMNNQQAMMNNMNGMNGSNNLNGINNMNNMGFPNIQNGNNPGPNTNGGYPFSNFQFKANQNAGQSFQYAPNNNSSNGRKISPFLSMNLNKPY